MTVAFHEFSLIDWFRQRVGDAESQRIPLGIGDDTAVLAGTGAESILCAVDVLLEGTHFTRSQATAREIGHKALAVNLSDIAAMSGRPTAALVGLVLNRSLGADFAKELLSGLHDLAKEFDVAVVGGDTNIWDGPIVVSVSVLGEATPQGAVRRNGARAGDWIMATGSFGGSLAGKHLRFQPRVREALALHQQAALHAMIDVSDGLAADLSHILTESGVGAVIDADAVPVSDAARSMSDGRSPLEHALSDGEDFELLFTVTPTDGENLLDHPPIDLPITCIGVIVDQAGCQIHDSKGNMTSLPPLGWQHRF